LDLGYVADSANHSNSRDRRSVYGLRTVNIRLGLESKNRLGSHQVFAIIIGLIAAVGLLLAALHAIEAALWAAAY